MSKTVKLMAKRVANARQHGCNFAEDTCHECLRIARELFSAGFVIVPREPTGRMLDAGVEAKRKLYAQFEAAGQSTQTMLVADHPAGTIWDAMIDEAANA